MSFEKKETSIPVHFIESNGEAVTPNDVTQVAYKSLYVGTGGNVAVQLYNSDNTVIYQNVGDGTFLPISVRRVLSTGTTASNIIGHL